jgi:transposase
MMVEGARDMTAFQHEAGTEVMKHAEEVAALLELHRRGWGTRRISRELGMSRNTVKRYLVAGGWIEYRKPVRGKALEGQAAWLEAEYRRHRGNAEVVRQELALQKSLPLSLRTVERAVRPFRQQLAAEAKATVRYETEPGRQAQADFGQMRVSIGSAPVVVHLFVMTLGYSRRLYVAPFGDQSRESWFAGIEAGFLHFGGVTQELLIDNAKALVRSHELRSRQVTFTDPFMAFSQYWGFLPRACAPYRARTKGKDENGVGYVKKNAIAGRSFDSWQHLQTHLG